MKNITNEIRVHDNFSFYLSDNGKNGDDLVSLYIAPIIGSGGESILYLETNGNPVLIGSIDLEKMNKGDDGILYLENDQPWWDEIMTGSLNIEDREDFEDMLISAELIK